jgi:hypothetical protein
MEKNIRDRRNHLVDCFLGFLDAFKRFGLALLYVLLFPIMIPLTIFYLLYSLNSPSKDEEKEKGEEDD